MKDFVVRMIIRYMLKAGLHTLHDDDYYLVLMENEAYYKYLEWGYRKEIRVKNSGD